MKLHALPIVEQWDCHHCGACCRETTVRLTADDVARLEAQGWQEQPEFRGARIFRRLAWLGGAKVLAHQEDGSCVFLTAAGRCRIHEVHGADAKPLACRQFPLQTVSTDRGTLATALRSCPSAAADRGRRLADHVPFLKRLLDESGWPSPATLAPPVVRGAKRSWEEFHRVSDVLRRLLVDERWPLVRRVVHALRFCTLVEQCRWNRPEAKSVGPLLEVLEQSAAADAGALFHDRRPPAARTTRLFRRLGAHFIRCYPGGRPMRGVADHWRAFRSSGRLARATGTAPKLHPRFPAIALDQLERPLGPLPSDVLRPLDRFFEAHAVSKRYTLARPGERLVESARRLAFAFPVAMWMLRWLADGRPPTADDVVSIVVALERGLELRALGPAAGFLAESDQLERLVAWYSR